VQEDAISPEVVRQALAHLHDNAALPKSPLGQLLAEHGFLRAGEELHALLLEALDHLKPSPDSPPHSHAWRRHRYLQLRYVEGLSHEACAGEIQFSLRQASRIHLEGLQAVATGLTERLARSDGSFAAAVENVGRQPPEHGVDVAQVALGARETLARVAAERGVEVRWALPHDLPPVDVNRVALRQILLNVMLHLLRLGPRSGGAPEAVVSVRAEATERWLTVEVQHDGGAPGPRGAERGEDVLLSAARRLAECQGAALDVATPDGSSVRLRLPVGESRTVLILDDNPEVGGLFQRMLEKTSYQSVHVRTPGGAFRAMRESRPAVIVLDVLMPMRDGWEVLSALQSDADTRDIPVVVCSVLPDRDVALSLGAVDFLAKPLTRQILLRTLDRVSTRPDSRPTG
jgi:CheY-like chemotaxis protein